MIWKGIWCDKYMEINRKSICDIGKETLEIATKTAVAQIPVGGALINNIWASLKTHAMKKRQEEWRDSVERRMSTLENTLENIGENEIFASTIIKATESALKTAENEKREYLANAVFNSVNTTLEESIVMIYMDLIDKYTLWHIKILHYFKCPTAFEDVNADRYGMGGALTPLYDHFPELKSVSKEIVDKIIQDLVADGMLQKFSWHGTMTGSGMVASRTSDLGNQFIDFVTLK